GFMMRPRIVAMRTTRTSGCFSAARHPHTVPLASNAIANALFANVRDCRNGRPPRSFCSMDYCSAYNTPHHKKSNDSKEHSMKSRRTLLVGVTFLAVLAALVAGERILEHRAVAEAAGVQVPMFEVDPLWPKPLPNHWILGNTIGVSVDGQDHVWIIHRGGSLEAKEVYATTNPPGASCCVPAPPVLEFDQEGKLLHHWGGNGPGYEWPESNHGITIDYKGNVWIGGNGRRTAPGTTPGGARGARGGPQRAPPNEAPADSG